MAGWLAGAGGEHIQAILGLLAIGGRASQDLSVPELGLVADVLGAVDLRGGQAVRVTGELGMGVQGALLGQHAAGGDTGEAAHIRRRRRGRWWRWGNLLP